MLCFSQSRHFNYTHGSHLQFSRQGFCVCRLYLDTTDSNKNPTGGNFASTIIHQLALGSWLVEALINQNAQLVPTPNSLSTLVQLFEFFVIPVIKTYSLSGFLFLVKVLFVLPYPHCQPVYVSKVIPTKTILLSCQTDSNDQYALKHALLQLTWTAICFYSLMWMLTCNLWFQHTHDNINREPKESRSFAELNSAQSSVMA